MPSAASLPEPLRPLARRNACVLDDRDWRRGVERLVHAIDDVIATGHFQAVDPPQVGDEPEVVDEPDVVGEPEVVDGEPERPGTPLWTRLRVHSRAIAAVAGIAVLVVAGALWLATRPGGGETGGGGGGGTTAAPDTAALVSSIKARMSEQAPGVTFAVESGCSRRAKGKPPPAWADNAVRLTFPVQACGSDLRSKNAFNGGNVFKVAVAKDGRADAAWNDVSASYQSAPDADGVYHSTSGSCNGAKRYGPTVYLIWWIGHVNGACPRAQDDPEWQSVDTALNEAVGSGGG
jgi:hypothetical protein